MRLLLSRTGGDAQEEADSTDPSLRADIFRVWLPLTYANPLANNLGCSREDQVSGRSRV